MSYALQSKRQLFTSKLANCRRNASSWTHYTQPSRVVTFDLIITVMAAQLGPSVNLTPQFNELLRKQNVAPCSAKLSLDAIDGFLKEAYRIVRRS